MQKTMFTSRISILLLAVAVLAAGPVMAQKKGKKNKKKNETTEIPMSINFDDPNQKAGYSLGVSLGANLKQQGFDSLNLDAVMAGIKDQMFGDSTQVTMEQAQANLQEYAQAAQDRKKTAAQEAEKKFLEENSKRDGVITTPSGLQYEIMTKGTGETPEATNTVTTHYHGTLLDGTVFDSSVQRAQPASFAVNRVIPGWTEALQLMNVGSKYKLFIPYALAYGERGAGPQIPPFSTLIFEVELLAIEK